MPLTFEETKQAALQYIGLSRHRSSGKVRARLVPLNADRDTIEAVIDYLKEIDYINDQRTARSLLKKHEHARAKSRQMLRAVLRTQGIPDDVIDDALTGTPDDEARALDLIESLFPDGAAELTIYRKLLARGFQPDLSAALAARLSTDNRS